MDAVAVAMHDTFLGPSAPYAWSDPTSGNDAYRVGLAVHVRSTSLSSPFDRAAVHALQELYVREFGSFVRRKIVRGFASASFGFDSEALRVALPFDSSLAYLSYGLTFDVFLTSSPSRIVLDILFSPSSPNEQESSWELAPP